MREKDLKKYWEMFAEAWQFFKRFADNNNIDWEELLLQARCLDKKNKSIMFREIIVATMNEIEKLNLLQEAKEKAV